MRASCLVGAAWLVFFAVATATLARSEVGAKVVGDVLYLVPIAAAAVLAPLAARRARGRARTFWALVAVSNLTWLVGEVIWAWIEVVQNREAPFPSLADVFYLLSYLVLLPAVLLAFFPALRMRAWRGILDASIVVAAVGFLGWTMLIQPMLDWGTSLATATSVAYPLFDVAILMLLVTVAYAGHRAVPASFGLVAIGLFVSSLADAVYTYAAVVHDAASIDWLNVGWEAEAVLLCVGALLVIRGEASEPQARRLHRDVGLPIVLAGVALTVVAVAVDANSGRLGIASVVLVCYTVAAVILRLLATSRESGDTARHLDRLLAEKEQVVSLLQATLDATVDGILVVDSNGQIAGQNRRFLEMWGIPDEIVASGQDERALDFVEGLMQDPEAFRARVHELYAHPEETSFDMLTFRDGRIFERSSRPQLLGDRTVGLVWSFHDVTEQRQLEDELRQSQKMEAVGRLAGGVAHDFNNLLTAVLGNANLLQEEPGLSGSVRDEITEIVKAAERAAGLTRQLLAFGRKQVMQPTVVDVNALVADMGHMLRRLIGEHIELATALAPSLARVRADASQLEQVILNLAINARDAMPTGGRLSIETANVELDESYALSHVAVRPGKYVLLAVSDTGTGMDEETKTHLFEPFFTTKDRTKGTGLGLATVYGIVKQSNGYIWVYSEKGHGSTFKVYLPVAGRIVHAERSSQPGSRPPRGTEMLLVVEDEASVRQLTKILLEKAGYRVLIAANAQEAAELFQRHGDSIALLITDVVMPGPSGPALLRHLSEQRSGLKVLYMSGYADDAVPAQGALDPDAVFLQKPFTADRLVHKVREALER